MSNIMYNKRRNGQKKDIVNRKTWTLVVYIFSNRDKNRDL